MANNRKKTNGRKYKFKPVKHKVKTTLGVIYVDDPKQTQKVVQPPSIKH